METLRITRSAPFSLLHKMIKSSVNRTISNIETGDFVPTARLALLLCLALNEKFEDLFYF
nr:transcriptional regulator [Virgibacillus profundi]